MSTKNQSQGHFKTGDLIIGSSDPSKSVYSSTGVKLDQSGVSLYGDADAIYAQQKQFEDVAVRGGGKIVKTTTSPKQHSPKNKSYRKNSEISKSAKLKFDEVKDEMPDFPTPAIKLETIIFENAFGKIKSKVNYIVDHPQAIMLVFADEDSMVFEPKVGEMLMLYRDNAYSPEQVYYPGVTFNSPDSSRKFMILFKVPDENQD